MDAWQRPLEDVGAAGRDKGRGVGDGKGIMAKIDFSFRDSGEPSQGRFYLIRSAKSGGAAAARHHPAHDERNRS